MTTQSARAPRTAPWHVTPAPVRAAGVVIGLTVLVAVIYFAFGWPAARSRPHDLPIGVTGPLTAQQLQSQLDHVAPGGFTVTGYPDQDALRSAIRSRRVYGGLAAGSAEAPGDTVLLTASGGSPAVAQVLSRVGAGIARHTRAPLRTEDLAPLPAGDRHGTGLATSALPMTLAGLLAPIVLLLTFPGQWRLQLVATAVFSVFVAVTMAVMLRNAFGSIDHNFTGVTAGLTLGVLALSLPVLGLGSLFGRVGLAAGVVVAVLLGHPLSGLHSAPEMLPRGWGALGQLLPQGANATLLRSTAYFSGAGAAAAILVLAGWAVAGTLLVGIAGWRNRA